MFTELLLMGKEFAGSRAPLVSALMDSPVLPLIALNFSHEVDIHNVELLTTSTHVKQAVSPECR